LSLYRQGRFPFDRMIATYPLEEIDRAIHDIDEGRVIKPVLKP
jgi:aryl-alcohol dehydrogenase